MIKYLPWLLLFCIGAAIAAPEDELLPADQAFRLTTVTRSTTVEATWRIAPGYYLYRDKFRFEALDEAIRLKPASFPTGKTKEDPYFGPSEIYLHDVTVTIPFERLSTARVARIRITAQGCNEPVGVCYPPIKKEIALTLPATDRTIDALQSKANSAGARTTMPVPGLKSGAVEPVDPDKAFRVDVTGLDASTLGVRVAIADCCYLYRDKMRFRISGADGARVGTNLQLGAIDMPAGEVETDDYVGRTEVYRRSFDLRLPLLGAPPASGFALNVTYQGCADKGVTICYPPTTRRFPVSSNGGVLVVGTPQKLAAGAAAMPAPVREPVPESSRAVELFLAMLGAFGAGLLLTFTPCVLPMIPIVSSVLVGAEGARLTKLRGGLLSYTYVLGTALTYSIAGAVAGATGEQLQAYFQNPWAIGIFSGILVLFALSMFGLYEIHVPQALQSFLHHHSTRMHHKAKRWAGGEFIGVFLLGVFSALIIGACVTPVLASALTGAIATQDAVKGAGIMFALANGQGAILVAIGVSEGLLLPRAGPWMNTVKHIFGVLLLGVAIYLLTPLEQVPILLLWGALFIICAVYLGATQALPKDASGWRHLWKGVGTLLLVWGVLALVGGFAGSRDVLKPLPFDLGGPPAANVGANPELTPKTRLFQRVTTVRELDAGFAAARAVGKAMILDYYATWCTDCVRMERTTLRDPRVRRAIAARFVALQADVTDTDGDSRAIKQRFNVLGPPATLFFRPDGSEARELRAYGYLTVEQLLDKLSQL
jgi:thiol:disulfide interchange protein DsbD